MASLPLFLAFCAGANIALAAVKMHGNFPTGSPVASLVSGLVCLGLAVLHQWFLTQKEARRG